METIKNSTPSNCHLWNNKSLTKSDLHQALETIKTYEDDSHLTRLLKKCKTCGQLYFYEFYEHIDWVNGNDPQYWTWIPVDNATSALRLSELSNMGILSFTSIRINFGSEDTQLQGPFFVDSNKT